MTRPLRSAAVVAVKMTDVLLMLSAVGGLPGLTSSLSDGEPMGRPASGAGWRVEAGLSRHHDSHVANLTTDCV